jgi:hypothetical protein
MSAQLLHYLLISDLSLVAAMAGAQHGHLAGEHAVLRLLQEPDNCLHKFLGLMTCLKL